MKVSLIGVGLMGYAMAERLIASGHQLTVFNRSTSKAEPLKELGATIAVSAKDAIQEASVVILMVSDARAIEQLLFTDGQVNLSGQTIIQMGTIAPSESIEIQKKLFKQDCHYFECPVLGSRNEAREGRLILLVGSSKEKFERWLDFLKVFGPSPRWIGDVGKAAALKLALNQLIAAHALSFSLSLGIIEKNEVDVDTFMTILRESALYAPMYDKKLSNWMKQSYENPNFPTKHLLKDVDLILDEVNNKGLSNEILQAMRNVIEQSVNEGLGDKDYSSVFQIINRLK